MRFLRKEPLPRVDRETGVVPGEEVLQKLPREPLGIVEAAKKSLSEELFHQGYIERGERGEFPARVPDGVAYERMDVRVEIHV